MGTYTVADGLEVLVLAGAGATVEHEEDGLVALGVGLLLDVLLVLVQQLGVETDVARLVDTVDIAKASSNREVRGDGRKRLVDVVDVLGLGVEGVVVNILVVDTILLAAGDSDFLQHMSVGHGWREGAKGHTISSHCFMGAARLRYFAVVSML